MRCKGRHAEHDPKLVIMTSKQAGSCRGSSIKFSFPQKGKSVFVKVSYEGISDLLLAQRAWEQVQQEHGIKANGDTSTASESESLATEVLPAHANTIIESGSVSSDDILAALQCVRPPEWHKNGATLRLPDDRPNASQLLTAIVHEFESCVQKQRAAAEIEDEAIASAVPPQLVMLTPMAAPQPASEQEQPLPFTLSNAANAPAIKPQKKSVRQRALPPVHLPPGVTLKQLGASEYYAELPCDRGTMLQIAGPRWRRMAEHLRPRALVVHNKVFQVKGLRDDVVHTVNMLFQEVQRFKSGAGKCEDVDIPHG